VVNIDKLLHVVGYALLGVLFLRGFRNSKFANEYRVIMAASILLTGLYGASDELHQYYVPYRNGNIWDLLFDFLGGIIGVYVYKLLLERYPKIGRI
jgi:VanZ family protein